ncbi:MAG: hypothetical protein EPO25_01360 [Gammaproteobacteria bacterium]|nr:MAG: hypothetical protein EPO25_01360 [Gammaproteobacteria bacterium]
MDKSGPMISQGAGSVRLSLADAARVLGVPSLVAALLLAAATTVAAQTPEQIEIFRNLPPEQQRQVLSQIGQTSVAETGTSKPVELPAISESRLTVDEYTALLAGKEQRFRAGDTLILSIEARQPEQGAASSDPGAVRAAADMRARVLAGNPYRLDSTGVLQIPGAPPIPLAGLTAAQSGARLNTEPALSAFKLEVAALPVEPELKPFGYDVFRNVPTTFAPATDIPVPADYVLGPGDTMEVLLIGEKGGRYTLTVGRDGVVDFPELGPIAVAGMRFPAAKDLLEGRVTEQMIGLRASVSMGPLRSIQVFVLGEAERPGSYTVSGLSTVTNALLASGGVKPIGSLRDIQVKRDGQVVAHIDLYDLLLNGDTGDDVRLLPGDVIFIPPIGTTVAIAGEVQRPAIYEVLERTPVSQLLYLTGGLTPLADPRTARLNRVDDRRNRTILDIDLTTAQGRGTLLQSGDIVRIQPIRNSLEGAVQLDGHVYRTRAEQFRPGMRLTALLQSLDEVRPLADLHYVLVRRETGPDRRVSVVSADLAAAFANPVSEANIALQARDRVHVFDLATSRDEVVRPIIDDLRRQSLRGEPAQVVGVGGHVKVPGRYPLEAGMTVGDLIRAGGGLDQASYGAEAELTRYEVVDGERRQTDLIEVDLDRLLAGDATADLALRPFDYLVIKEMPLWGEQESVTLAGEVRFPGTYPIRRGETLRSVVDRAGGLTDLAFVEGSAFTRRELKAREQRQISALVERLQRELASLSLQQAQSTEVATTSQALAVGQALLAELKQTEAAGRLVIDLDAAMRSAPGAPGEIVMKDGDFLAVPRRTQEVTVIGEVQNPTSHLHQVGLLRDDYIASSGGTTQRADERRTYIVRANGRVLAGSESRWFGRGGSKEIRPGDTIVVPVDVEQVRPLTLWGSVTQILYNIAVAVAAVNSF